MICDAILNMPDDTSFGALPAAVQATIRQMRGEWPAGMMPGTRVVSGRRLTHVLIDIDTADPLATIESAITAHQLDWQVLAMQGIDASGHLAILRPVPVTILDYLEDTLTVTAPPDPLASPPTPPVIATSRPTQVAGLHLYEGHPPWAIAP
ncbi:MAG: hypothetical protein HQL66_00760 [Magnetococcales bacterium]|nr:hypothetical protein [Magnetococcales bacterium]